ncbi:CPBP family intramembrane glutamic endopeptidase [Kocuria sp. CPCC 205300]|uniref:CPBP family intramembrane glutamic endopeptidase n=1 Tax=Kocuria sabuli TaxID=3071448 RepID=UPI0036DACEFC
MTIRTAPWGPGPLDHHRPEPSARVLPYHRLAHADPEHRWWKPLVELLLFGAFYLVLAIVFGIVWAVGLMAVRGEEAMDEIVLDATALEIMDPAIFFMLFFSLVLMIPALLAARAITGPRPIGLLLSVTGRLRWDFLARCLLVALGIYALGHAAALLLELAALGTLPPPQPVDGFWWLMAMIVLVVPLQSAAEELVFRGYLLQSVGRWLRRPVFAILLPVPLFTFGHLYDAWGLLAVAFMAVVAGWLTWRTGGLEAAIALHVVNNVVATLFGAFGLADPDAQESTWVALALSAAMQLVFAWLAVRIAGRRGVAVTRTVRPPLPAVPGGQAWAAPAVGPGGPMWAAPVPGPEGWVCPGPPACPGHWAGRASGPAPQRLP